MLAASAGPRSSRVRAPSFAADTGRTVLSGLRTTDWDFAPAFRSPPDVPDVRLRRAQSGVRAVCDSLRSPVVSPSLSSSLVESRCHRRCRRVPVTVCAVCVLRTRDRTPLRVRTCPHPAPTRTRGTRGPEHGSAQPPRARPLLGDRESRDGPGKEDAGRSGSREGSVHCCVLAGSAPVRVPTILTLYVPTPLLGLARAAPTCYERARVTATPSFPSCRCSCSINQSAN
mmetsp:Transcript_29025/g.78074  ORF Transcript_29025/g.78074 Transcript_29025/m.78074 type:complete len:228 (-) Transcript_29025:222-905(-)